MSLSAEVRRLVHEYSPLTPRDSAQRAEFAERFVDDHGPVRREDGPVHATASAFVFDPSLTRTLLVFHGKGRFWVQPGGHLEPEDASISDAALREMLEETGVSASVPSPLVYDLDHHALSSAFGRCASHLDIGIAIITEESAPVVSAESEDVRWWPLDALPSAVPQGFERRLLALHRQVRRSKA